MTNTPARYLSAATSHQGVVRGNNEDRVHADDARGIYLVIDGMGGHAAGERAAEIARDVIKTRLERLTGETEQRMREAITLANNAIFEAAAANPECAGMACVLTAVVIEGERATAGHVGDSRLYQLRRGKIEKLTPDHSPVGEREDRGELTESEAMRHPRRNEVFRDVGSHERIPDEPGFIDVLPLRFAPESALLLCSDGLSDSLPSARILEICEQYAGDRWTTVNKLIEAANERGKDNVSVVFVEGEKFAASFGKRTLLEAPSKVGEDTSPLSRTPQPVSSGLGLIPLWIAGGMLLGAMITFAAIRIATPHPHVPAVLNVAAPATIASVLTQAVPGDTLHIAAGTYDESIALKDGVNIDATGATLNGSVTGEKVHNAKVSGLVVHGAVDLNDSAVDLERCTVTGSPGSGIRLRGASGGRLVANDIKENAGAGVSIEGTSTPELRNNVIAANGRKAGAPQPGLVVSTDAHPVLQNNTFVNNGAEALWLPKGQETLADANIVLPAGKLKNFRVTPETTK